MGIGVLYISISDYFLLILFIEVTLVVGIKVPQSTGQLFLGVEDKARAHRN